jgi:hypothetical protein
MIDWNDKTPLAFVNVDGVLTSAKTYWAKAPGKGEARVIDQATLRILAQFCVRTKARMVMASAWSNFLMKSPEAWRSFFEGQGQPLPVIDMLPMPSNGRTWTDAMVSYMEGHADVPYIMFEDDPGAQKHPRVIEVDARVGLSTVNLQEAAELLEPGSALARELAELNRGFSPEKTIHLSLGGKSVEVHPRDLGKGLVAIGAGAPAASQ